MNVGGINAFPEFKSVVTRVAGANGVEIARTLMENGEATDEEIANQTGIDLKLVRKILYDFYDSRVASYKRSRNSDSGWYVYHWRIEADKALELQNNNKRMLIEKLQEQLEHERERSFYSCGNDCPRLEFDEAVEYGFKCPNCGEDLQSFDNSKIIEALERQVESVKRQLPEN